MTDYTPWRCPCGQYLHDAAIQKSHLEYCDYDPVLAVKHAARRMDLQREPVKAAIQDLIEWKPVMGIELAHPPCSECGWERSGHLKGGGEPHAYKPEEFDDTPFLSESYLYPLMGKDDARSLLAHVRRVANLAGYEGDI